VLVFFDKHPRDGNPGHCVRYHFEVLATLTHTIESFCFLPCNVVLPNTVWPAGLHGSTNSYFVIESFWKMLVDKCSFRPEINYRLVWCFPVPFGIGNSQNERTMVFQLVWSLEESRLRVQDLMDLF